MSDRRDGSPFAHRLQYMALRGLVFLLDRLPEPVRRGLGRGLGRFTFSVLRLRRAVALENLRAAFPDWRPERIEAAARASYEHFGVVFLELLQLRRLRPEEVRERAVPEGESVLRDALARGRGVVVVTAHLGNWEVAGAAMAARGLPLWVTARRQRNRLVDRYVTRAREQGGMRVIKVDEDLRPVLRALRNGDAVAFLADQDAGRRGCFVSLLGRLASTPLGPARFAIRAGSPVVSGLTIRNDDGTYQVRFTELSVRDELPEGEKEIELTRRFVAELETQIRAHPEQWLWGHRRWKTRPPEGGEMRESGRGSRRR